MPSLHLHTNTTRASPAPPPAGGLRSNEGALRRRERARAFLPRSLTLEQVSDLLAAAFDVKCSPCWGRSAPAARAWQQVTVYAMFPEATYRYDPYAHRLVLVKTTALSAATGFRDVNATAPVHLVYVVDIDAMEQAHAEEHGVLPGADAGRIVENVYRYCTGAGLATVVCGPDRHQLAQALGLKPSQRIVLAQAVGHPPAPGH
jgi:hypothetical protein